MVRLQLSLAIQLLCLAQSLVIGQDTTYNYGFDVSTRVKRQLARRQVVRTGGEIHVRQEIRELEKDQDMWSLYILGLSMLQFTPQSSPTSWYGIAGIHGAPFQTWGGVGPSGSVQYGYCAHSSVLFPTWHRPYMVLYEQVLHNLIQTIATFWPDDERPRFEDAARRFRIPYWDWAASPPTGQSVLPLSVGGSPFIDVDGPNGVQRIANPLFSYAFKPLNASAFSRSPWNFWSHTLRGPTDGGPNAQSNNSQVAQSLDLNRVSISQRLYALFSHNNDYKSFGNSAWRPESGNASYDSLESLHDTVHYLSGGGGASAQGQNGHMSYIPYSAFDPIFFLHHCMVDRIFALWQTLHPETWVTPTPAAWPTYTYRRGQVQDASSELTPFFSHENGTFWTSDGVRDFTRFGYTYAELADDPAGNGRTQARVKQSINRLYGTNSPANLFLGALQPQSIEASRKMANVEIDKGNLFRTALLRKILNGDEYREWTVNVRVDKQALDGPFSIHFFLGEPPLEPEAWTSDPNHVGTMGVFAHHHSPGQGMPGVRRRDDDEVDEGVFVSGAVPLTAALMKKIAEGELASLQPRDVDPYLKKTLDKRVLGPYGRTWGLECARVLRMSIVSSVVRAPYSEDELPQWEGEEVHYEDGDGGDGEGSDGEESDGEEDGGHEWKRLKRDVC
ncbi:Di-copper centre-containing protein [Trichocladium antarcticum]|uniref:Di-copper centre-containing protein n=1 Tax=Trichocladium antarcticum TaxID=1450529 RepID=A0AAN6UNL4_9PEZI|nr:Di-copper centre-containing protein [Trichocladium antarcticum]